jgi:flagellar biosynthesis/type III secretory pathway chaperone
MNTDAKTKCRSAIKGLLLEQIRDIGELIVYFDSLKASIVENNITKLDLLLGQNLAPELQMDILTTKRKDILNQFEFDDDRNGIESAIKWCDQNSDLARQYQLYTIQLSSLQRAIQVNRLLTIKGQEKIRQSLLLLSGNQQKPVSTYASDGHSQFNDLPGRLAQA